MAKVLLVILAAVIATIASAEFAYRQTIRVPDEPVHEPWSLDSMEFRTWNGRPWTAWIRGEVFELVPQDQENWSRHSNRTIAYSNWEGELYQAKIDGDRFLLAHRGDWMASVREADAIRYRDWEGKNRIRTVAQLRR